MFNEKIVCAYLYTITKYGYPPPADLSPVYVEEMAKLGFRSIELEGIREKHLLKIFENREIISRKIAEHNLNVPYFCAVLPGLTSINPDERKYQLELFEKGCRVANVFGSLGILDNAPLPPYIFPDDIPVVRHYDKDVLSSAVLPQTVDKEKFWEYTVATYREACDIAAGYNLTYQMHPSLGVLASNAKEFIKFHEAVNRDNLRFNFDTANQFYMKENLRESLTQLKDYIDYIHLSDNGGMKMEHLPAGSGAINWNEFLETLDKINFNGHIGIDVGGQESGVPNLDSAYLTTAKWIEKNWIVKKNEIL